MSKRIHDFGKNKSDSQPTTTNGTASILLPRKKGTYMYDWVWTISHHPKSCLEVGEEGKKLLIYDKAKIEQTYNICIYQDDAKS